MPAKDQIWWRGVNISDTFHKLHGDSPVKSLPRRRPQWQSVSEFFVRAREEAAQEQPGFRRMPEKGKSPGKLAIPVSRAQSPGRGSIRPRSATGVSKRGSQPSRSEPVIRRRPQSAPALLRNDMPGLMRKTHEDPLRQHVEDVAVQKRMEWLKREGRTKRDFIERVDVLSDPILFDLKVNHNSAVRARSASKEIPSPRSSKSSQKSGQKSGHPANRAAENLRRLCGSLSKDTRHHCARMRIPAKVVEADRLKLLFENLKAIQRGTTVLRKQRSPTSPARRSLTEDPEQSKKPEISMAVAEGLKNLWGPHVVSPGDMNHPLVRLAYFISGSFPGRMRMILEAFDWACTGSLTKQDFCVGLEFMGYSSTVDYSDLFTMLDAEGQGRLDVRWLEDHLENLVDAKE
ncbi:unnamed protein product [Effrenium voratum]|nr:unnamed protein product [Effrenium voratum]